MQRQDARILDRSDRGLGGKGMWVALAQSFSISLGYQAT